MQGKLVWRLVLVRAPSALLRGTGPTSTPPSFIPPNSMGCRPADDIYKGQDPSNRPRRGRRANCYNGRIKLPGEREREREKGRESDYLSQEYPADLTRAGRWTGLRWRWHVARRRGTSAGSLAPAEAGPARAGAPAIRLNRRHQRDGEN